MSEYLATTNTTITPYSNFTNSITKKKTGNVINISGNISVNVSIANNKWVNVCDIGETVTAGVYVGFANISGTDTLIEINIINGIVQLLSRSTALPASTSIYFDINLLN